MSLHVILGPMFSGKTSKLLEIYEQCILSNISVLVINHSSDTRYSDSMLSTHNKKMIPCRLVEHLQDIVNASENVILINEGQFFDDLYDWVKMMVEQYNKTVYVCGLDGDSNRKRFGQMLDLIPICDKVTKLRSLCAICKNGNKAPFTLRTTTTSEEQILIGSDDCYKPVCRNCYFKNSM
jgi:thymidine kinase